MIDAHRGAFEHDWRARFSLPLSEVGKSMSWGEALRLTERLLTDSSSFVAASVAGWDHPLSHQSIVLMNLYDLTHQVAWAQGGGKGSKPKPYPRPWSTDKHRTKPDVTQDEVIAALRMAGHNGPLPMKEATHG